MLLHRLFQLRL